MRSPKIDPAVQADLDALDAALRGERPDLEVAIIADEARDAAEPMPPSLALRLGSAIEQGFADPARPHWSRRLLQPAMGLGAAALIAVVVAVGQSRGGSEDEATSSQGQRPAAAERASGGREAATVVPAAADSDSSASMAAPQAPAPDSAPRRVQRAAELTISTPLGELQDTSDEVARTTDRLGGFVQRSDVFAGDDRGRATFELRIPAARLDDALAQLSRLGHVENRSQRSEDITGRFTSARARLKDARTERQALLQALAAAATTQAIDSIKQRLEIANARIEAAKGDLSMARRAASFATVSVAVVGATGEDEDGSAGGDGSWTPGQALDDAVALLEVAAGVFIVAAAAAVPAGLVALLIGLGWRAWRRRSRNLALGAS